MLDLFIEFMWPTILLVGTATLFSTIFGIAMGIYAGWRRGGKFDKASMYGSLVLYSMPEFWLGMLLILLFSADAALVPEFGPHRRPVRLHRVRGGRRRHQPPLPAAA